MEISMFVNAAKLMCVTNYTFKIAVRNIWEFEYDNFMIINHDYHGEKYPEITYTTGKVCRAGYPVNSCYCCGRCEY